MFKELFTEGLKPAKYGQEFQAKDGSGYVKYLELIHKIGQNSVVRVKFKRGTQRWSPEKTIAKKVLISQYDTSGYAIV